MKHALATYQPASNWMTVALLTIVMMGFGVLAEGRAEAKAESHTTHATAEVTGLTKETQS